VVLYVRRRRANRRSRGINMGFFTTLFLVLLILKLTETIIISWSILILILFMPFFLFLAFTVLVGALAMIAALFD